MLAVELEQNLLSPTHTLDPDHGSEACADAEELQQAGHLVFRAV